MAVNSLERVWDQQISKKSLESVWDQQYSCEVSMKRLGASKIAVKSLGKVKDQ